MNGRNLMSEEKEIYVEEKPSKWTFGNYFKSIGRLKWWVIGASVVGAVLGFVSFQFILNPRKQNLSASFIYTNMPAESDDLGTYKFVDGTVFNINDLVSYNNIKAVKASKEEYAAVDVDEIYNNNALSISTETVTKTEKETTTILYSYFTMNGKANVFPNVDIAKSFMFDLINYPKTISENAVENFQVASFLSSSEFDAASFDQQVSELSKQYKVIKNTYGELESTFGGSTLVENKQLIEYISEFNLKTTTGQTSLVDNFVGQMNSQHLYKFLDEGVSAETKAKANCELVSINETCGYYAQIVTEKSQNVKVIEKAIEYLANASTTNTTYNEYLQQIVAYTEELNALKDEVNALERQLEYYGWEKSGSVWVDPESTHYGEGTVLYYLDEIGRGSAHDSWVQSNKAFETSIKSLKDSLLEERQSATKVYRTMYKNSKVVLLTSGYVVLEGGMSPFVGLAAGLVAGFLISSIACCAVYISKEEKE